MHFPQEQMENSPRQTVCDTTKHVSINLKD